MFHVFLPLLTFSGVVFSTSLPPQHGDLDLAALTDHVLKLEESVSNLQSQSKTQDQKYAAVLASVLSKLTSTTDEMSGVKNDYKSLKTELASVKMKLNASEAKVESLTSELMSLKADQELLEGNMTSVKCEMSSLCQEWNETRHHEVKNVTKMFSLTEAKLQTVESEVQNLSAKQGRLTSDIADVHGLVNTITSNLSEVRALSDLSALSFSNVSECLSNLAEDIAFEVSLGVQPKNMSGGVIKFNLVKYNSGSGYNNNTGYFTAPVSGTYMFWVNAVTLPSSRRGVIRVQLSNGTTLGHGVALSAVSFTTIAFVHAGEGVNFHSTTNVTFRRFSSYGGALFRPILHG